MMSARTSPAPLGRRLLAAAIDAAFVLGIVGISIARERATPFDGLFTFLGFGVAGVAWWVRDTGGASPGKRLMGLVVSRADGERVDSGTSARRNALLGAGLVLSGAGTLLIADPFSETMAALSTVLGGVLGVVGLGDAATALLGERRRLERWAGTRVLRAPN